ncbi:MAG: DUF1236 domain-containing protein [Xanthobacteraceae bacterium]
MNPKFLIITAAAALVGGTVLAAAQGMQKQAPGAGAEGGAQGQIQGQGGNGKAPRAKGQTQGQGGMTQGQGQGQAQGQDSGPGKADKGKAQRGKKQDQTQGQGQGQGQGQRNGEQGKQGKQGKQGQRDDGKSGGKQGAQGRQQQGGAAKLTTEQRTKIRTTVIQKGPRVANVNFSVNVGTVVPRGRVKVVTVPPVLVEIYPRYRGYLYFIVGERIVIIEPSSYKIVAVLVV